MKKLLLLVAILMAGMSVYAQKGVKAVGLNLDYGTEISNVGFTGKFQYGITNAIRVEPAFTYYLKKDGVNLWDITANVHYLFNVTPKFTVYPLVGIGYAHTKASFSDDLEDYMPDGWSMNYEGEEMSDDEGSSSSGNFCANFGAGAEYKLTDKLSIGAEFKYQLIDNFNQFVIGIGATYKF